MKWNAANPQWIYQNHRSLYSDFKRGEKSLTGNAFGLEWFYDSTTRMTFEELGTAAMSGDRSANSRIARLLNGEPYAVQWNMQGHIEAQLSAELDSAWRAKFNKQSEKSSSDQGAQR